MRVAVPMALGHKIWNFAPAPGAERAATAIQLPVYASLTDDAVHRVAAVVKEAVVPA